MIFKPGQFKNFLVEMKRLSKTTNFRQPLNKNLNAILAFLHSYDPYISAGVALIMTAEIIDRD